LLDRLLTPLNRAASQRFIAEARDKVWHNAAVLDRARKAGPDHYATAISQLDRRSAERVADLRRPGQVVLRLARRDDALADQDHPHGERERARHRRIVSGFP
jgi:hypothetical protein